MQSGNIPMQMTPRKHLSGATDLRHHFHNYFELLVGAERSKLLQAIATPDKLERREELLFEIDFSINYLRGAVRMGKLLCLIDQEEAKAKLCLLSAEREQLRARTLEGSASSQQGVNDAPLRFSQLWQSLQATTHL